MSLTLNGQWMELDLGTPLRVISWAINRPGLVTAQHVIWREVRNADLPPDLDVSDWFRGELAARGRSDAVAFLTSRTLARHNRTQATVDGITARCTATTGLSNAERIGTRTDYSARNWGTINLCVSLSIGLTDAALIEAMSIAAQARTAAVMDAGVILPAGIATGTGTDCIAVAAPAGDCPYAGLHTPQGEALGRTVYDAIYQGAMDWRGDYPHAKALPLKPKDTP